MSATPSARPIWLPVLYESGQPAISLLGEAPFFAKGAECRFMISIFEKFAANTPDNPGTIFNVDNVVAFILKIYGTDFGSGTLLLDTSDAAAIAAGALVSFNYPATAAQFFSRAAAQIEVYLPDTLTANVTAGARFGVLTGATGENATRNDWFGNFNCTSKEVGLSTVQIAPTPAADYVRNDVFAAALAGVVKFGRNKPGRYPVLVNENGTYGRAVRVGANGEAIDDPIPNP